jgi:hypothetical protein
MIIDADELDEFITSTRESIQESPALQDIRRYLQRKFDEVANYYFNNLTKEQKGIGATVKVSQTPASLSRRPLFTVAKKFFSGEIKKPLTIDLPERLSKKEQDKFLDELEKEVMDKKGIIKEIVWEAISPEGPIGRLNLKTGKVQINLIHPFFANFAENINSSVPFQLIAITEILTEAHLIENGMNQEKVEEIMWFRDQLLRELTFNEKKSAAFVYQMIQASLADPGALEDAVFHAFQTLGFKTTKLGGAGKPDGHGVAPLGFVDGKKKDYSLVYDAKSTKKKKIAAGHARISAIKRHRTDYNSDYAIVVAVDFVGGEDPKSAVSKEAKADNVCLIRARDLMTLVMIATPKQLGYSDFKDLFENNHTVKETSEWIEKAKNRPNRMGPVKELLETTAQLMQEDTEPPEIGSIRIKNEVLRKSSKEDLRNLVISLTRLVPGYISLNGDIISLNVSPEVIMKALSKTADSGLPSDLAEAYSKVFKN